MTHLFLAITLAVAASASGDLPRQGQSFVQAAKTLRSAGWQPAPAAHLASGEYFGLDRELVEHGYPEVDSCSVDTANCIFQYVRGNQCQRLLTQGEQLKDIVIVSASQECIDGSERENMAATPGDVRYLLQWRDDCDSTGQCEGLSRYEKAIRKKYRRSAAILDLIKTRPSH